MQFKIGTSLYIGGNSKYQIKSGVQGLESPAIRIGDGLYAGRDGGFVSGHFYGHRTIVIPGFYIGSDCEDADSLRRALFGYLRIRYRLPIFIQVFSGHYYYTEGYIADVKANITSPVAGDFQLTILCPDPILYYGGDGTSESNRWVETVLSYGNSTTVTNLGNVQSYPIITLVGEIENPIVENETTGESLQVNITTTNATDALIIDMENRIITLNDTLVNADRASSSQWWYLPAENSSILLDGDSATLQSAKIRYKRGYVGI